MNATYWITGMGDRGPFRTRDDAEKAMASDPFFRRHPGEIIGGDEHDRRTQAALDFERSCGRHRDRMGYAPRNCP